MKKNIFKQNRGITLIALVITIVILIILATISINAVLGEDGLVKRAEKAAQMQSNAEAVDREAMSELDKHLANAMAVNGDTDTTEPEEKPLVTTVMSTDHTGILAEDTLGNPVYIPGKFKLASDSGRTVQEGIVIEDESGNQFVWIPVSNINHDGSNKIKIKNEDGTTSEVEITLGRYTFDNETGEETKVQYGSEYAATTLATVTSAEDAGTGDVLSYRAEDYYYELTDVRESNGSSGTDGTNTTAKDLAGFITSVSTNKGYYLARYEASYASGSKFGVGEDETYYKPASKPSTSKSTSSMSNVKGKLWNYITQGNAAKACRQMYYGNNYVGSDLCNSYAWDTAILYIQAMGNSNYANQTDGNGTLRNTGETGDEVCKIFDMAANLYEWTTEYCTVIVELNHVARPCSWIGGVYSNSISYPSRRNASDANHESGHISFRSLLYIKNERV